MHELLPSIQGQLSQILEDIKYFIPEIYFSVLFLVVLLADLLFGKNSAAYCKAIAIAGLVIVLFKDYEQYALLTKKGDVFPILSNMLFLHSQALSFKIIIDVLLVALVLYFSWDEKLAAHPKGLSDLYTIVIGSALGLHLMVMAMNMMSLFLGIEFVSIASYLLVAYRSENALSAEAGLKYVLFGAASSAVLLYGISLLYGLTGTLDLFNDGFIEQLTGANSAAAVLALALVLAGIGFKLSFVPVHFWVPDVYEGAPTPITAYLSTVPKIAAFALLVNFLTPFIAMGQAPVNLRLVLGVIGIVTMIAGNFAAIAQNNVKRMLAYSSIGHTGFALMAIVTFSPQGLTSLIYYLAVYSIANIGALVLASYFTNATGAEIISGYKGLGFKYPVASVCFVIILISLTGIPISAGFTGKLFVFSTAYGAYQQNHEGLLLAMLITGAVTTVLSLFYYIKIPLNLFLKKTNNGIVSGYGGVNILILSIVIAVIVILLGFFPNLLYNLF
ncbi:NADH-quinone oxidoreductase subunit N [Mucilaginibacter limnophilus]|uniref:NADH-quinone oxidoreductase subunit N n=1 Tax=Mucilaginibacter limnophilus TaxID=1932778 RepID=A0A3S3TFL1_9SPHI|nr:NADH-quinone oxidoreductase subunit N [Mucilaginibacter limnophilus]RVT99918.1 NADH-quinone oxidoreductase subunit N [Mucilaginibacter limnophilus]